MTEQSSPLERSLNLTVPLAAVHAEVEKRLKRLVKTARVDGFRPGKVPMRMIQGQYGQQVMQEVLGDAAQASFSGAVQAQQLRVAGTPHFETLSGQSEAGEYAFKATFEVLPEVVLADLSTATIERPVVEVGDADVDRTLDILRRQRTQWVPVARAAQTGDRVKLDYRGLRDGVAFDGGTGENQLLILGSGQFLPEFELALPGASAGEARAFELTFPSDYHAKELAGQPVRFEVLVHEVQEALLPEVDAEFARSLGIESGDIVQMRGEIHGNLEREAKKRIQARVKDQVMKALVESTPLEVPRQLVGLEIDRLRDSARQDWAQRTGQDTSGVDLPAELFQEQARRRVALGLILTELVRREKLEAAADQVRTLLEEQAQSYEQPEEMVRWYYEQPERLREVESVVLEDNVVNWALGRARVTDTALSFQELIGKAG
jgi:trigger factor